MISLLARRRRGVNGANPWRARRWLALPLNVPDRLRSLPHGIHPYRDFTRFRCHESVISARHCTINLTKCRINCTLGKMKPRHDIQNAVRQHRLMSGLTQEDLADRVGVTRQTILSIEKGKYTPSVALALALAEVFGETVETLFQLKQGDGHD